MAIKNSALWWGLNLIAFSGVIVVNALANILPINGHNTGEISNMYPNLFVPAGFTFSIWGIIYLLLMAYCIATAFYTFSKNTAPEILKTVHKVQPLFFISCLLNISWIMAWHHLLVAVSLVIMVAFLLVLVFIFIRLPGRNTGKLNSIQQLFLVTPFTVYLAWICVATIANVTAVLVHYNITPFNIDGWLWSCIMIFAAVILGSYLTLGFSRTSVGLVISWALFGIYSQQNDLNDVVGTAALGGLICMLSIAVYSFIVNLSRPSKY